MHVIVHNPSDGIYAAVGEYAHAIEVHEPSRLLFTAGTMGLDPAGAPGRSLDEQLELVWSNIRIILASAHMTVHDIVRLTSYLRSGSFADANGRARVEALGGRIIPTTVIVAETLVSDWLIEIEVVAAA